MSYVPGGQEMVDSARARIGLANAATNEAAVASRTTTLCSLPFGWSRPCLPRLLSQDRTINHLRASKFRLFRANTRLRTEKGPGLPVWNARIFGDLRLRRNRSNNTLEKRAWHGGNNHVGKRCGYLKSSTATSAH